MNANLEGVGEGLHPACRQEGVVEVGPLLALLGEEEEAVDPSHQEVVVGAEGPWPQGAGVEGVGP